MRHLILFLIIVLGFLIIKCSFTENIVDTFSDLFTEKYRQPDAKIKYSYKIEANGVFTNVDIEKGDVIEICPTILEKNSNLKKTKKIRDYFFQFDNDNSLIALGYCSMYNHSDNPNATWEIIDENTLKITALAPIKAGEEIYVSYGDEYWKTRNITKK